MTKSIKTEDLSPEQLADIALAQHGVIPDVDDIVYRLRKRAEIRRQIPNRKSVQEGQPDRIADLLDEAADEIETLREIHYLKAVLDHGLQEIKDGKTKPAAEVFARLIAKYRSEDITRNEGRIKWFDEEKQFGFIYLDVGGDVFISPTEGEKSGLRASDENEWVTFVPIRTSEGNISATEIKLKEKDDVARNEGPDGPGS